MNARERMLGGISGFMAGIGFTIIAFHFNHKNILNENVGIAALVFVASVGFCLKSILKDSQSSDLTRPNRRM